MRRRGLTQSFVAATRGLVYVVATQRNMKIHVVAAVMVMLVGMALPLGAAPRTALLFSVALVLFAEVLNTALENFVDLHIQQYARAAMLAKDAAAAGVLVLALGTVGILAEIVWTQWDVVTAHVDAVVRSVGLGVPLVLAVAALLWSARQRWLRILVALMAVALAVPLWTASADPVFSVLLGGLLILAMAGRPRGRANAHPPNTAN